MVERISTLLATSFELLAVDAPRHHARLARALAPHRVCLHVDGEVLSVASDGAALRVSEGSDGPASARITAGTHAILDALDARCTLAELLHQGRLAVVAPLPDLDALREALLIYVRGGVRSASFPGLVRRLRARAGALQNTVEAPDASGAHSNVTFRGDGGGS